MNTRLLQARYNSFNDFCRERFGHRVYKVNVDAGFTCPNRDGTVSVGGCIYCNNDSFRPDACRHAIPIEEQIKNGIEYIRRRYKADRFIIYFQPFTNTYAPVDELERLYKTALMDDRVIGLAIGTRPDCIDDEKLCLLEELSKRYFILIEYGVQSIYDKTLRFINRGHNYQCFKDALKKTKGRGIYIGSHIILGFPTETMDEMLYMADELSRQPIDFLKIHQLQIVRDTALSAMYERHPFHVFSCDEYIGLVCDFFERLSPDIYIQRLFATAPDNVLIAPHWDKSRHQLLIDINIEFDRRDAYQGRLYKKQAPVY